MKNIYNFPHVVLLKSRLSRRIVIWVFTSIVLVEFLILMPSVYRRQEELLGQLEEVGLATMLPLVRWQELSGSPEMVLAVAKELVPYAPVLGGVIYLGDGEKIGTFGEEIPNLSFTMVKEQNRQRQRSSDGDRYDVAWIAQPGHREYPLCQSLVMILGGQEKIKHRDEGIEMVLVLRLDASGVRWELKKYVVRIAGLVLIICLFVTLTTMVAIGSNLIVPILQLRQALLKVAATKGEEQNVEGNLILVNRDDELGDVMDAFNSMRSQIYNHLLAIKDRELKLESLVQEVNAERDRAEKLLLNILPKPNATASRASASPSN
ncbi:MAG TPA: HAMP domain-containing protein [Oscillatoriaceae cyanobacterium M33_DOE_052]|nr:HAMP domain-containing protein [Oscillatoriaceae cyanobacterium M33_DOE_052]